MDMAIKSSLIVFICFLASYFNNLSTARMCSNYKFTSQRFFSSCKDLLHLSAHLHWNYNTSMSVAKIAYRAQQGSHGWVAWAINPNQLGMVGSEALVAFHDSNGSITVYLTMITSYSPTMPPEELSFRVSGLSTEFSNDEMTIYAFVGPFSSGSLINQVWQAGSLVADGVLKCMMFRSQIFNQQGSLISCLIRNTQI